MTVSARIEASLRRRYAAERRFRAYGLSAIVFALSCLALLFVAIGANGVSAFLQTRISLEVEFVPEQVKDGDWQGLAKKALWAQFPEIAERRDRQMLAALLSSGAGFALRAEVEKTPSLVGGKAMVALPASADVDQHVKGNVRRDLAETERRVNDRQAAWVKTLEDKGLVKKAFNSVLFTAGDSREPEQAGILGALTGSLLTMAVTLVLSFPVAVGAAVYLEEFAPKNRFTQLIEVNINNLAAVPSIVFGLLGLAMFLNFFGLPRSAPLVGGMVLALMTLPTIIIAGRVALKSVPPSIREAAFGLGASPIQVVFHHVLPLALPGILTGTIIGMARALGESAPLLMIGMVAFIVNVPAGFTDPATVMPVQVYLWSDAPERAFVERTSAAIIVLLGFLVFMNALAVYLRKRFEIRW
ncbi:MAG: phosphate ABC transporter permease PstA [Magnetospirillum sp. WYHS-4]